jgi:lysophospholipase L1-like esterase
MIPLLLLATMLSVAGPPAGHAALACATSAAVWGGFPALTRSTAALNAGLPLRIVALGSSSTAGSGATAPDRTYPAQLEQLLRHRFPAARIEIVNRGRGGETVAANLARIDRDVLALQPDLVIWQVGTNDALRGIPLATIRAGLQEGITKLRATGADVVLLDPQPLNSKIQEAAVERVEALLVDVANATKTVLLPRHRLMDYWVESGQFTPTSLLGPDGLHMTDASYRCLAERIADLFPMPAPPTARPAVGQ